MDEEFQEPKFFHERRAAGRMLRVSARRTSEALNGFSGWMIAGFGAGFALLVSNIEQVAEYVSVWSIKRGLILFVVAAGLHVLTRWMGTLVIAGAIVGEEIEALGRELGNVDGPIDLTAFVDEIERGLLPPYRWAARRSRRRLASGDLNGSVRLQAKVGQVHGTLVIVQAILLLIAAGTLARGIAT